MVHQTDWDQPVEVDGESTTLRGFLKDQYRYRSDAEMTRIYQCNGFEVTKAAVEHQRRRSGWSKAPGVAKMAERDDLRAPDEIEIKRIDRAPDEDVKVFRPQGVDGEALLDFLKNHSRSLRELSREFDRSEVTMQVALDDLKAAHYNIIEIAGEALLDTKSAPQDAQALPQTLADMAGMRILMAWLGDTHGGSKAQQITNLLKFIELAYERGVRHVLFAGDLFAGDQVYRGQLHDLFAIGAEKQFVVMLYVLPKLPGLKYYVIGGNHDYSFVKANGYNVVAHFASQRDDVVYLGYDLADVPITDRVDVRLWHPSGGVPYAMSYRLQKGLEQMTSDELSAAIETQDNPRLRGVAAGHLHVSMTMWQGPIFGAQVGCFEGQTNYLKRKALFPKIGGYLIEWQVTDSGLLQECTPKWQAFLEIEDDYKNYPELLELLREGPETRDLEPLFQWQPDDEEVEQDVAA